MSVSAATYSSLFEASTFHLVTRKISFFFYWENLNQTHRSSRNNNNIQNIRQHHFETNKGLIFDYALLFVAYCRPNWKVQCALMTNFETLLVFFYWRAFLPIFMKQFLYSSLLDEL